MPAERGPDAKRPPWRGVAAAGRAPRSAGFSLLELLVAVAVILVIAAVAVPVYRGHISTSRDSAVVNAMTTMAIFQEDLRLRTGAYGSGGYDAQTGDTSLTDAIGWRPTTDDGTVYVVTANGATSWRVTATTDSGRTLCRVFPAREPCS